MAVYFFSTVKLTRYLPSAIRFYLLVFLCFAIHIFIYSKQSVKLLWYVKNVNAININLFKKMAMILIAMAIPVYLSILHFINIFVNIFFKGCKSSRIATISFRLFYLNEHLNWIDDDGSDCVRHLKLMTYY